MIQALYDPPTGTEYLSCNAPPVHEPELAEPLYAIGQAVWVWRHCYLYAGRIISVKPAYHTVAYGIEAGPEVVHAIEPQVFARPEGAAELLKVLDSMATYCQAKAREVSQWTEEPRPF